jgi:hypothetical protein
LVVNGLASAADLEGVRQDEEKRIEDAFATVAAEERATGRSPLRA